MTVSEGDSDDLADLFAGISTEELRAELARLEGLPLRGVGELARELRDYQEIANRCRWENLGYRDGQLGTPDDVAQRLADYERFVQSRDVSLAFLRERLTITDEMVGRLILAFASEQEASPEVVCPTREEQYRRCRAALQAALHG